MAGKTRLNFDVSHELNQSLDDIAADSGRTKTEVFRQALALLKVAHDAKRSGKHIGLVSDASKLDSEIIGLL